LLLPLLGFLDIYVYVPANISSCFPLWLAFILCLILCSSVCSCSYPIMEHVSAWSMKRTGISRRASPSAAEASKISNCSKGFSHDAFSSTPFYRKMY
jgi:hypothetical protein